MVCFTKYMGLQLSESTVTNKKKQVGNASVLLVALQETKLQNTMKPT